MLVMLIVCVSSAGTTIVHFRPKWLESSVTECYRVLQGVRECYNHCPLPAQVAGEQGRAGADHRRADVEEGGHLEGA